MTKLQRILGTSILSLLLVIVGLFVVCSGRVQDVAFEDEFVEDEFATDSETTEEPSSSASAADDLLGRLELLEESSADSTSDFDNMMAELDGMGENGEPVENAESSLLTDDAFNGLQNEVNELNVISSSKARMIDSLRSELDMVNSQKMAMGTQSGGKAGKIRSEADVYNTEYGLAYQDALDDFYVRNYERAIRKFRELLASNDRSPLADNCQYWIGEAFFAMGNYYQAIAEFQKVLPLENNNKSNDAQLMIGISFIKAGEPELARAELNTVINFAGNSSSAQKAMRYLKMLNNA